MSLGEDVADDGEALRRRTGTANADAEEVSSAWAALVTGGGTVSRSNVLHLVDHIEVRESEIRLVARSGAPLSI